MSDSDISIASISNQKLEDTQQKAQVNVLKKALDQKGEIAAQLIEGAGGRTLPEGVGAKVNTVA
jgi:Putative motility protein